MRVAFLGTADFAIPLLEELVKSKHEVVGVVTGIDKPAGRGKKLRQTPVRVAAEKMGLKVITTARLKSKEFLEEYRALKPDVAVVTAFRILPEQVFDLPPLGTLNVHPSLLPKYRGPAPVQWALINGDEETGVSVFRIKKEVDAGGLVLQRKLKLDPYETAGDLFARLDPITREMLLDALEGLEKGTLEIIPQDDSQATKAPKLTKEDGLINWSDTNWQIHNRMRGLTPWPGSFTSHNGMKIKLFNSRPVEGSGNPGEILQADKELIIACGEGALLFTDIQREGKKRMKIDELLRGYKIETSEYFK